MKLTATTESSGAAAHPLNCYEHACVRKIRNNVASSVCMCLYVNVYVSGCMHRDACECVHMYACVKRV